MVLFTKNQLNWEKPEWISFVVTFCILIIYPLMNGFPFIFYDSWDYASGHCPDFVFRSPVLGCAMRPVLVLGGLWGFVVVQSAITAFSLVFLSSIILKRNYIYTFYITLFVSCVGLFAGYLMADVWTLIGLICIFSISLGYSYLVIAVILAISYSVHFGNFPVFTATAVLFLPFARCKTKYTVFIFSCIIGSIILLSLPNLIGSHFRIGGVSGIFSMPSSRILHDIPDVIVRKCQDDPEFKLCEIKEEIIDWSHSGHFQVVTWEGQKQLGISWKEFDDLSKEVVLYSSNGFFYEHLLALIRNIYSLLFKYELSNGFGPYQSESWIMQGLELFYKDKMVEYEKSWQAKGRLEKGLKRLELPLSALFGLSIVICLSFIGFYWRNRHEDVIVKLAIFAMIAVFLNAFFMSALSGPDGRYQNRISFLVIFPSFIIISRLNNSITKRIKLYIEKEKF